MTRSIQKAAVLGAAPWALASPRISPTPASPASSSTSFLPTQARRPGADRNKIVRAGLDAAKNPARRVFHPSLAEKISIGNFEDDLARVAEADWIIEVVAEISKSSANSFLASPNSASPAPSSPPTPAAYRSISLRRHARRVQQHWAGTHFFNRPVTKVGGGYTWS